MINARFFQINFRWACYSIDKKTIQGGFYNEKRKRNNQEIEKGMEDTAGRSDHPADAHRCRLCRALQPTGDNRQL